eukprot:TRINITY_DN2553_c0_g1_i3.p1 TRINITY_DN2553_c0_g1~~TRINITY_DN2553_c0_g1_i3.p1  ORF type:complete len:614 (+),score=155.14 TRINITY_DN2553_c0_g1_i3:501-2342(+)
MKKIQPLLRYSKKVDRIQLIESILSSNPEEGGAGEKLDELVSKGIISAIFPMHSEDKRKELLQEWGNPKKLLSRQPIDKIRNYFGEEIALYFAWLGFYTNWLIYASILGVFCGIFWLIDRLTLNQRWATWFQTVYSVFLAIWATLFLEYWKRKNSTLNQKWGTLEFKLFETQRPSFYGEEKEGIYHNGVWVNFGDSVTELHDHRKITNKYYPSKERRLKIGSGLPLAATMITVVVVATLAILAFRLFVQSYSGMGGSIAGATVNAISIIVLNVLWKFVATKLTEWENYRTKSEFMDSLTLKIFIFYFVNSYTSLFYIAFFKGNTILFSNSDKTKDRCVLNWVEDRHEQNLSAGCPDDLSMQLVTILLVNIFVGQTREVLMPWIMGKAKIYLMKRGLEGEEKVSLWERDSKKPVFEGTFEEYSEMVIQYGYLTIFASSFPLAPLLALINNVIEIRTDAFKLLTAHPRPPYKGAASIGMWFKILEFLGLVAVVTNCALIGLTYIGIYEAVGGDINCALRSDGSYDCNNPHKMDPSFVTLGIVLIIEHVVIGLKFFIAWLVPDVPVFIKEKMALEDYIEKATLRAVRLKKLGIPTFEVDRASMRGSVQTKYDEDDE